MPFSKEIIAVLLLALAGAGAYGWRLESRLTAAQENVGRLESENTQLNQTLKDSEKELEQVRSEMTLWRDLYTQLQDDFEAIRKGKAEADRELAKLRRQPNVEKYLACPMPDELYRWVRDH